jgi:hypothetical protein
MYIARKHISRRTALKGLGATIALPLLDAMVPAVSAAGAAAPQSRTRLIAIEMVQGSAGSTAIGERLHLWSPPTVGTTFDLSGTSMSPLEPFRDYLTIISNTDVKNAEAFAAAEIGGDHFRSSAVFLTQCHPKQTQGSDLHVGTSLDQVYAKRFGQDTPIPSMQLCIDSVDQAGGCAYGYSCAYTDSISWSSPSNPLPMIRDPRAVFDQLFGVGATEQARAANRRADQSLLDWVTKDIADLQRRLGAADRARLGDYLENIREVERRIQRVEAHNSSGEAREMPEAPIGVPDAFDEHVKLMFDLQVLGLAADVTRIFSFKMARDATSRAYPESGVKTGFHPASHHQDKEERILEYAKINKYHVSMMPYLLERLKNTTDADGSLLDHTLVIYGSPMGNSNVHNHKRCPLFLAGRANGKLRGNLHLKAPDGTPMANVWVRILHDLGMDDVESFGDSTGAFDLMSVPAETHAAGA